jgi:hypothetical protein
VPPPATQVLALKTRAKLELQRQVGLDVGADYQLMVFMGRMTHQKGCDIIAQVGKDACAMADHPLATPCAEANCGTLRSSVKPPGTVVQ